MVDDETASRVLDAARELPGAGPQPLASPLPAGCTDRAAEDRSTRSETAAFPEGVCVAKVSPPEFREAGAIDPKFEHDWTLTTRFGEGRWDANRPAQTPG